MLAEWRWRTDRLVISIGRFDAASRLCLMFLDVYDRLRHRGLISRLTFNLPLTQVQMADHLGLTLVHVNRTLRRLREERIAIVDRGVVMILDLDRLRAVARGLPEPAEVPEDSDQLSDKMHSAASASSGSAAATRRRNEGDRQSNHGMWKIFPMIDTNT
jgi:hypothetical protein